MRTGFTAGSPVNQYWYKFCRVGYESVSNGRPEQRGRRDSIIHPWTRLPPPPSLQLPVAAASAPLLPRLQQPNLSKQTGWHFIFPPLSSRLNPISLLLLPSTTTATSSLLPSKLSVTGNWLPAVGSLSNCLSSFSLSLPSLPPFSPSSCSGSQ